MFGFVSRLECEIRKGIAMAMNMYSVAQSRIWSERVYKEDVTRLLWHENTKHGDLMGKEI